VLKAPDTWIDAGLEDGTFPRDLPHLKRLASRILNMEFESREAAQKALASIPAFYREELPGLHKARSAEIDALPEKLLKVFDKSQFPAMKTTWKSNPDHIGHTQGGAGCFRCHDGKHVSDDGQVIRQDCNLCHSRPAFGKGQEPLEVPAPLVRKGSTHNSLDCDACHQDLPARHATGLRSVHPPRSACLQCHEGHDHPTSAPMGTFACGECHKLHPDSPKGGSCLSCHEGVQDRGRHASHLDAGLSCTQCHEKHTWKPGAGTFQRTCVACHEGETPSLLRRFYGDE
jgi:hypothetical protein